MSDKLNKKILIIEDEATLQKALSTILIQEGFDVHSSLDGENGYGAASAFGPDLILLDLILPKMDGYEVLAKLKKEEKTKDIPIVILTNLGSVSDVQKALDLGATTYLVKTDYDLADVVDKIKQILMLK